MNLSSHTSFFAPPKFMAGSLALDHIPIELEGFNASRPMLITDKEGLGLVRHLKNALANSNVSIAALYDETPGYVNPEEIKRLSGLFMWRKCDAIIALGGRAVTDTAKYLRIVLQKEGMNPYAVPLIYIATAGIDGREPGSTLCLDGKLISNEFCFPDIICIDSRMLKPSGKEEVVIWAAMAALGSSIEGAILSPDNHFVHASAYTAIRLISEHLPVFAKKTSSRDALLALTNGIVAAGSIASGMPQGIAGFCASAWAKESGLDYGMLYGFLLPHSLRFYHKHIQALNPDLLLALGGIEHYCNTPLQNKSAEALKIIDNLTSVLNKFLPKNFAHIHLHEKLKAALIKQAKDDGSPTVSAENCRLFLNSIEIQ